jgi:hypothetical protein
MILFRTIVYKKKKRIRLIIMKNTFDQTVNFMIKFQRLYKKITSFGPLEKDNGLF